MKGANKFYDSDQVQAATTTLATPHCDLFVLDIPGEVIVEDWDSYVPPTSRTLRWQSYVAMNETLKWDPRSEQAVNKYNLLAERFLETGKGDGSQRMRGRNRCLAENIHQMMQIRREKMLERGNCCAPPKESRRNHSASFPSDSLTFVRWSKFSNPVAIRWSEHLYRHLSSDVVQSSLASKPVEKE